MLLTSNTFLFLFLPFSLIINYFNLNKKIKTLFIGILSGYFYFIDNGYLIIILIFLSILMHFQIKTNSLNNVFFIILLLLPLIVFKYSFLIFNFLKLDVPNFIINNFPIGLSFFTFQAIAYYFDKERLKSKEGIFDIFTFLTFFPQLLAGPIVDIETYRNGIKKNKLDINYFSEGIGRLALGLFKKFFIADTLSQITSIYMNNESMLSLSTLSSILLIFSYTFQIYFDFSAYCDIAIGIGLMFGFKLPENFNKPYLAKSFQDFWRKWHITLSNFFKNFVYIPLGGNRTTKLKNYRNLWITFFLTALWHGATLNFLIWGFCHGFFLTFEKIINYKKIFSNRYVTFIAISLTWVPFFSKSLSDTLEIIYSLTVFKNSKDTLLPLMIEVVNFKFLIVFIICIFSLIRFEKINLVYNNIYINLVALMAGIVLVILSSVDPFIYFKF